MRWGHDGIEAARQQERERLLREARIKALRWAREQALTVAETCDDGIEHRSNVAIAVADRIEAEIARVEKEDTLR